MTIARQDYSFSGVANGTPIQLRYWFNLHIENAGGFDGTVVIERSFHSPADTWKVVETYTQAELPVAKRGYETEAGVRYRLSCTVRNAGTVIGRLSQ